MSITRNVPTTLPPTFFADDRPQFWGQIFGHMVQNARELSGRSLEETAELAGMEVTEWLAVAGPRGHLSRSLPGPKPSPDRQGPSRFDSYNPACAA